MMEIYGEGITMQTAHSVWGMGKQKGFRGGVDLDPN